MRSFTIFAVLALLGLSPSAGHCDNDWVWIGGSESLNQIDDPEHPIPGTVGYPGARSGALHWTDNNGDLWLYGGASNGGGSNRRADMWTYSTSLEMWTYIGGETTGTIQAVYPPAIGGTGHPGGRSHAVCWVDPDGNLCLFGGFGRAQNAGGNPAYGRLNDVWRYQTKTDTWVWLGGSQRVNNAGEYYGVGETGWPAAREYASHTIVDNHLYLYGGYAPPDRFQDFWRFDLANMKWEQLGGDSTLNVPGVIPPATGGTGYPGSRYGALMWPGERTSIWLMGGYGEGGVTPASYTNDLWKYDIADNAWTCHGFNNIGNYSAGYEQPGSPNRRSSSAYWNTAYGMQFFGGAGLAENSIAGRFNDHWIFNEQNLQWIWMDGSQNVVPPSLYPPVYGMNGSPKGRSHAAYWYVPKDEKLYLFGGVSASANAYNNDFWVRDAYTATSSVPDWQLWD